MIKEKTRGSDRRRREVWIREGTFFSVLSRWGYVRLSRNRIKLEARRKNGRPKNK